MNRMTNSFGAKWAMALAFGMLALACDGPNENIGEATDELIEERRALDLARDNAATEAQAAAQEVERARAEAARTVEAAQAGTVAAVENGAEAVQEAAQDVQDAREDLEETVAEERGR